MQLIHRYRYYILGILFAISAIAFWPGYLIFDSDLQLQQALQNKYADHHPPLMAFLWHFLNFIYSGQGPMFVLQLVLLYSAVFVLLHSADLLPLPNQPLMSLVLLALPIYPQVLIYEIVILKDVSFAFSFLLVAAILAYYTILKQRPPLWVIAILLVLMLYGAAVKYQGQYCVIVLALWLGCLIDLRLNAWGKIAVGLLLYALVFCSIGVVNNALVPHKNKDYAWQYVKLYDLAAISLDVHQDLIPDFNKTPKYSFQALQKQFGYPAVDSLVFWDNAIFKITKSPEEMQILYNVWLKNIMVHPIAYIKHRAINLSYIVISRPGYRYSTEFTDDIHYAHVRDVPYVFLNDLPKGTIQYYLVECSIGVIFYVFMSHLPVILLGVVYFILALRCWRLSIAAPVLLGFSATALLMVALLFVMSMAGTPRYSYISIVLIHASHIFAYACLKKIRRDI